MQLHSYAPPPPPYSHVLASLSLWLYAPQLLCLPWPFQPLNFCLHATWPPCLYASQPLWPLSSLTLCSSASTSYVSLHFWPTLYAPWPFCQSISMTLGHSGSSTCLTLRPLCPLASLSLCFSACMSLGLSVPLPLWPSPSQVPWVSVLCSSAPMSLGPLSLCLYASPSLLLSACWSPQPPCPSICMTLRLLNLCASMQLSLYDPCPQAWPLCLYAVSLHVPHGLSLYLYGPQPLNLCLYTAQSLCPFPFCSLCDPWPPCPSASVPLSLWPWAYKAPHPFLP